MTTPSAEQAMHGIDAERLYVLLARGIDGVPPARRELFLAKLALLFGMRIADRAEVERLIEVAADDLDDE